MSGPAVVLVGPMGVGKTTVGRILADRLGVGFRDTDADVVQRAGKPVADIFLDDGEPHFRALEREAVRTAVDTHAGVLALGGGAVMAPETRALLTGRPVAFLEMEVGEAVRRVGLDAPRPLLAINPRQQWRTLMEERRPLYTEVARAVVPTGGLTPEQVADDIMDALELRKA
ncbi:shikimate kinase [Streptomyces chumphonensis]|uniref:shikimate kinase n=1 Tax=Streptomyces chumphonensis TaxID=1214925 RepID=UPI003D75F754